MMVRATVHRAWTRRQPPVAHNERRPCLVRVRCNIPKAETRMLRRLHPLRPASFAFTPAIEKLTGAVVPRRAMDDGTLTPPLRGFEERAKPMLRGMGLVCDLRRARPHECHDELRESTRIIKEACAKLRMEKGDLLANVSATIRTMDVVFGEIDR
jgi:hypothetical protein